MTRIPSKNFIVGLGVLGVALIVCTLIARNAVLKARAFGSTITVTGSAIKPIRSDMAIWEGNLTASAATLDLAYAKMKKDLGQLEAFLAEQKFVQTDFSIGPVQINRNYNREGQPTGYNLYQSVTLRLADVDRIATLAQQASTLIEKGVELTSLQPRYMYTKLEDVKIEMIKAATENAKLRANQLAQTTGSDIGAPVSARIGVFQIRPQYSQEVSDYGINDMSSIDKEIVSTVSVAFRIE